MDSCAERLKELYKDRPMPEELRQQIEKTQEAEREALSLQQLVDHKPRPQSLEERMSELYKKFGIKEWLKQ